MQQISQIRDNAINLLQEGKSKFYVEITLEGKEVAFSKFSQGLQLLIKYNQIEKNEKINFFIKQKMKDLLIEFEQMKFNVRQLQNNKNCIINKDLQDLPPQVQVNTSDILQNQKQKQNYNVKFDNCLKDIILEQIPDNNFTQIYGFNQIKNVLKESIIIPKQFSSIFCGILKPYLGVLIFGPPRSGKSAIAQWCCKEIEGTLLKINLKDMFSKYFKEQKRVIQQLFQKARENKPSIIHIQNVDSIIGNSENEDESKAFSEGKSQLFLEFCENTQNNQVFVIGSTNAPWALDPFIIKRFQKRIYVPQPNYNERLELITSHMDYIPNKLNKEDFEKLAQQLEGYSRGDIRTIIKQAQELRSENSIEMDNLIDVLKFVKQSIKQENFERYENWKREFSNV